jgi:hypothetical protein
VRSRNLESDGFDLIYTAGSQPVSARLRAVELYGKTVIPMVPRLRRRLSIATRIQIWKHIVTGL